MRVARVIVGFIAAYVLAMEIAGAQGPPGPEGGLGRGRGRRGFDGPGGAAATLLQPPQGKDPAEQKILDVLAEMERSEGFANVSPTDGRYLRLMAEAIDAKKVVELGTSTGYSGVWLALALRSTGGHLYTHEIDDGRARIAQGYFDKAGVAQIATIVMGDGHATIKQHLEATEPIDLLFLDADKEGYVDYLEQLLPKVRSGGLIVAHNMMFPPPDPRFIAAITKNPELETTFVLMDGAGMAVTLKKR